MTTPPPADSSGRPEGGVPEGQPSAESVGGVAGSAPGSPGVPAAGEAPEPVTPQFVDPPAGPSASDAPRFGVRVPPPGAGEHPSPAPTPSMGEPRCPRHPQTVSHVLCQRCDQPTCVECQRPAAVGVQCVTCVGQAAAMHPGQRTVFGGLLLSEKPVVTWGIMIVCGVVYLLQLLTQAGGAAGVTGQMVFVPVLGEVQPWRFITGAFAHSEGSMVHIASNMLALWFFGREIERLFGQKLFAAIYLLSAIAGNVMVLLLAFPPQSQMQLSTTAWLTPTLGASGAIFGLFGAALLCAREQRLPIGGFVVLFAMNAAIPLFIPNISWQAHVGGLVMGLAITAGLLATRSSEGRRLQWGVVGACLLVVVALVVVKYAMVDESFLYSVYGPVGGI